MGVEELGVKGIIGQFYAALEAVLGASWVGKVAMMFGSDQETETYKWLGMSPAVREWIGERLAKGLRANGLDITNKLWESTLELGVDELRRDKTGQINVRIGELAERAAEHWAKLLSTFITNGTGSTNGTCYDGQYFFDSDHSEGDSGTQKNLLTSSEVATLNVTTATAPTASEAVDAILGVVAYMMNYKDDQGEPMNANAKEFLIMTSPALMGPFAAALGNTLVNTGSGAIDNTLKNIDGFKFSLAINPRLTYTTQFATFRVDGRAKPMICQEEQGVQVDALGPQSEHAFKTNKCLFGVKSLHNVGYGYWQHAAHSTMS